MFPDIPVTLEAEPEEVQTVKSLDKFAKALSEYEIGFKHRWKNWLIKTVAPGEQSIINEKTGSSIEVLSTMRMGKDKVKKTLQEIDRLQPKNMQDYFDKLDKEQEGGIPPHNPGTKEIITKYRIIPFPDRDPQGLLFDTREEAEKWLQLADVDLPIKEVEGVYKPGVQKVGMLTAKGTMVFTPIKKGSSSNPGIPQHNQSKITWKYNRFGHVEIWKGTEMEGESDLYIQIDYDVGHFFYLIGLSSDPEQIGAPEDIGIDDFDTVEDPGYFTDHNLPECKSCG